MVNIDTLIEQIRAVLIETEDAIAKHEIYNRFINECRANNLAEDDFYKKVLKPAHKSVDWNYIEEQKKQKELEKKQKEAQEKEAQEELGRIKKDIQQAPKFINRLVKTAFDDNVVERNELIKIFEKADNLSQDTYALAERINTLIDEKNYKAYPKANFDLPSLRETLCSTDWHSEERYRKITTPPPPPPEPFPWKMVITAVVLFGLAGGAASYFFYFKEKWLDDKSPRYYVFATNVSLRSSKVAGVDNNYLASVPYGAELIAYDYQPDWSYVKYKDQKGYVSSKYNLNGSDFLLLNNIFSDAVAKTAIETSKCRMALLDYVKRVTNDSVQRLNWKIFTRPKDVKPNTIYFNRITNPASKFTDFAFIIKNTVSGERRAVLYSFTDDESPVFVTEQNAPADGNIIKILRYSGGYNFYY